MTTGRINQVAIAYLSRRARPAGGSGAPAAIATRARGGPFHDRAFLSFTRRPFRRRNRTGTAQRQGSGGCARRHTPARNPCNAQSPQFNPQSHIISRAWAHAPPITDGGIDHPKVETASGPARHKGHNQVQADLQVVESWASGLTHRQATHIPHPRRRHVTQGRHPTSCMAKQPPPLGEGEGHGPRTFPSQASATPPRARARQTRQWLDPGWSSSPTSPTRSSSPPEILLFSRHSESFPPGRRLIARCRTFRPPQASPP